MNYKPKPMPTEIPLVERTKPDEPQGELPPPPSEVPSPLGDPARELQLEYEEQQEEGEFLP